MTEHSFTKKIMEVLTQHYGKDAAEIYEKGYLLQYLNIKTRSADKGSKSRGSFANLYAIYVLVEDYLNGGFGQSGKYSEYEGAVFSRLFERQRQLPFGRKLQNHALNHRFNEEFKKYFPTCEFVPILRKVETNRYWINENLLVVKDKNIAKAVIEIIKAYIETKREALEIFIQTCREIETLAEKNGGAIEKFIFDLLAPNVDARLFEIVSYAILKFYYRDQKVYFGFDPENLTKEYLHLYKTGRTNANDGGIDYVMKPLGRFFQVTETLDVKKYFLDIDKVEKFPLTFVIKAEEGVDELITKLKEGAEKQYSVKAVVDSYMACIEEVINIPILKERFATVVKDEHLSGVLDEIIRQSTVEFNYDE